MSEDIVSFDLDIIFGVCVYWQAGCIAIEKVKNRLFNGITGGFSTFPVIDFQLLGLEFCKKFNSNGLYPLDLLG